MDKKKVLLSKSAFNQILRHVFRYGSQTLKKKYEVIGLCFGKKDLKNNNLLIIEVLPLTHFEGISDPIALLENTELEFFNEKFSKKEIKNLGWYYSIPGGGLTFNEKHLKSQLFFQSKKNPEGFCIILDPMVMEKDVNSGLKIFHLRNIETPESSKYEEIQFEIQIPNDLEYFNWIKILMEYYEVNNTTFILEESEKEKISENKLQEIPQSSPQKEKQFDTNPVFLELETGTLTLLNFVKSSLKSEFDIWLNNIMEGATRGTSVLKGTTNNLKKRLSSGVEQLEKWNSEQIKTNFNEFRENLNHQIELNKNIIADSENSILDTKKIISNNLTEKLTLSYAQILSTIKESQNKISDNYGALFASTEDMLTKIQNLQERTRSIIENIEPSMQKLNDLFGANNEQFNSTFKENSQKMKEYFQKIRENFNQYDVLVKRIEDIISETE